MSITVNSAGAATVYAQPDVTFGVDGNGLLEINVPDGTVAIFDEWYSVSTDAFDVAVTATPPVATAPVIAAPNAAPPEPTPHVEATEVPVEALPDADASTEPPASTDVVIPAGPSGVTIGSPATSPVVPGPTYVGPPVTPTSLSQPGGPVLPPPPA